MPNKLEKWGVKVWCLACSISKYVWNFKANCGKEYPLIVAAMDQDIEPAPPFPLTTHGEAKLAHNLVVRLLEGLWHHGHVVVMDNYFSSIRFFLDLLARGTYATGTVRANRIGLPKDLKNTKAFKNVSQGTTSW